MPAVPKPAPVTVVLELEIEIGAEPIQGRLVAPERGEQRFRGWLALSAMIVAVVDETAGQGTAPNP